MNCEQCGAGRQHKRDVCSVCFWRGSSKDELEVALPHRCETCDRPYMKRKKTCHRCRAIKAQTAKRDARAGKITYQQAQTIYRKVYGRKAKKDNHA